APGRRVRFRKDDDRWRGEERRPLSPSAPGGGTNRCEPSLRVIADAMSVPAANAPTVAPATGADVAKSRTTPEMRPPGESPKSRGATRCDDATETGVAPAYTSCCG